MTPAAPAPAILYARFSTPSQERGDSLERQLRVCREFAAQHNLHVTEEVVDLGKSAYKGDHVTTGNLGKLTARIMAGDVPRGTTIIVEKGDRLSRQKPRIVQRWIEDVCDRGIRIAIRDPERWIDAQYLDEGSNTIALLDILMTSHAANIFSKNLSDRMNSSWLGKRKRAAASGVLMSSNLPAWLRVVDGKIELDPDRTAILRRIFTMTAEGIGAWTIANTFNQEGIEPWGHPRRQRAAKVRGWNSTYIRLVIKSPAVDGDHHLIRKDGYNSIKTGEVLHGYFPRAIEAELVRRARASQQTRGHKTGGAFAPYARNLFSQIARCHYCDSSMILTGRGLGHEKEAYLQCSGAKKRKGCDNRSCYDYKAIERTVLEMMLPAALDDRFFAHESPEIVRLVDEVAELEVAMDRSDQLRRGYQELTALRPADERLRADWFQAAEEVDRVEKELRDKRDQLAAARGATSPAEHLARVRAVSNALQSDDEEVMRSARRRVQASLREVVTSMRCRREEQPGRKLPRKLVDIALANGLVAATIDDRGEVVVSHDFRDSPDHILGLTGSELPGSVMSANAQLVDDVLRRSRT